MRIMDVQGTILARYPNPEEWVGERLPEDALLQAIQAAPGDGTAEVEGLDGIKRLYAFTRLRSVGEAGGAYLSVGIPTSLAYAEINRSQVLSLVALSLVAILTLAAAWVTGEVVILRQVRTLVTATRRLAAGDLGARSGLPPNQGEISELSAAFDQMASKLEEREAQLKRSNQELQDFAYIASHDLQEPLRKIQAFGERLSIRHRQALSQEGQEYIERMVNDAARLQTMINDLLAYSRVSTRTRPFEPLSLSSIAAEAVSDLQARQEETGGKVEIGSLPVVEGDALQLRQLFQNLIGNALKFHRPNQPPVVKVYARKQERPGAQKNGSRPVQIVVEDNGIGFDEKYLNRIFEPFQRLHGRGVYEGSGIGLSICRKIAERHGGRIEARSRPGEGAQFIVTLPVKQPGPVETGGFHNGGHGSN
jgi:signal transduction histidine kinase